MSDGQYAIVLVFQVMLKVHTPVKTRAQGLAICRSSTDQVAPCFRNFKIAYLVTYLCHKPSNAGSRLGALKTVCSLVIKLIHKTHLLIYCFMSLTLTAFIVLGLVLLGPLILFMLRGPSSQGGVQDGLLEIVPHALMTEAEKRFFEVLERSAPSFLICPQVAMSAIVTRPSHQNQLRYRAAFSQKRLDFVLVDRETLTARLVVELDDSSHRNRQAEDAKRDEMLKQAGYPVLRVPVRHSYNVKELSMKVCSALERQ